MMKMTAEDQKAHDSILEHEIAVGFRTKVLPPELQAQVKAFELPALEAIRLTRMNPRRRKNMNEAVQRAYQKDLQNEDILSNEQIMSLVVKRGEWGPEKDARIKELQQSTNAAMSQLYLDGFSQDSADWLDDIGTHTETFRTALDASELSDEEKTRVSAIFDRWVEFSFDKMEHYTAQYAESQGLERYSHERDAQSICDALPTIEVIDAINNLEESLDKLHRFVKMTEDRKELAELQNKHARIFADSVEARRETAEEMARLYFTCERIEHDKPAGPIAPSFDELWDLPDDVIQWLLVESYFFHNGIPDETRPYLETFGFIRGGAKENTDSEQSEESVALPSSSPDSPPQETTPSVYSESTAPTT